MHIDEMTCSLISHESRMNKHDDTPLENSFKSQLHVTRDRGRGRDSRRGKGARSADHSDSRNDSKSKEKL